MFRVAFLSLIFAAPIMAIPPTMPPEKLTPVKEVDPWCGIYEGIGEEGVGKTYEAIVVIRKVKSVYTVQWTIGGTAFVGIGQVVDGKLCVGWAQQKGDQVLRGCTVYESVSGGLKGLWVSLPGDGAKHKEDLKLLKAIKPGG